MTAIESELLDALRALEAAAPKALAGASGTNLRSRFDRSAHLAGQLPAGSGLERRHFLERKSDAPAREHLERLPPSRGTCGGGSESGRHG